MTNERLETAQEIIRRVDPNYGGNSYNTRLDWLAASSDLPIHQVRSALLQAGAEFQDPADIAPESWFTIQLRKPVNETKIERPSSGFTLKPSKGRKIGALPSQDSNADIFGDHKADKVD